MLNVSWVASKMMQNQKIEKISLSGYVSHELGSNV